MSPLLVLALACAAVAVLLFALGRIGRRRYEVIYCDAPVAPAQALVSRLYGIKAGRIPSCAWIPALIFRWSEKAGRLRCSPIKAS